MPDREREGETKKKPRMVEEQAVGGISKTGLAMFSIGCGCTLPCLMWMNKCRLMSSPLYVNKAEAQIKRSSTIIRDHATRSSPLWLHYEI